MTDSRGGEYERTSEWVEYNDLSDSDGDGNNATFTTPMYNYPQVNFSDESVFVECDSSNNKQCMISSAAKRDVFTGLCVPRTGNSECSKFDSLPNVGYSCSLESGICEASGSCDNNDNCEVADAARCDIDVDTGLGLCVSCDDDSQCSNEKFEITGVDYFCSSLGVCEDKDRREGYFYRSDTGDPDSTYPNPINNYIESESKNYNVIF